MTVGTYIALIPSENAGQPDFVAVITATCQPQSDGIDVYTQMQTVFDLDTAVGDQLDALGEWIGITRNIAVPITGVYFAWDTVGLGWDQGVWQGPYDPSTGLTALPDGQYRTLLRAKVAANNWDGTNAGAQAVLAPVFPNGTVFVQDNQDMTMLVGYVGPSLDALTYALFTGGYLDVRPASVEIRGYAISSVPSTPIFGFDANDGIIGGWDVGSWATVAGGN